MSTSLISIQEKIKAELSGMKDAVPPPAGRNISTKGKLFTFPDGKTHQGPIQAVVLDFRNFNRYYDAVYNAKDPKPPLCFALDKTIHLKPHAEAREPQHAQCEGCQWNEWGSAPSGSKGKACRNTVRLAVTPPDATAADDPYILTVSPTALKSWAKYVAELERAGKHPIEAVAEISFDANTSYPTLLFRILGASENVESLWAIREKAQMYLDQPPISGDQ